MNIPTPPGVRLYMLDAEHHVVRCRDVIAWGRWMEDFDNRRVAYTDINVAISVSTVFLGINHRFGGRGPPLLFETMVFTNGDGGDMWRYSSWDDAAAGHEAAVRRLRAAQTTSELPVRD